MTGEVTFLRGMQLMYLVFEFHRSAQTFTLQEGCLLEEHSTVCLLYPTIIPLHSPSTLQVNIDLYTLTDTKDTFHFRISKVSSAQAF
jgi:hypothetical protein